MRRMVPQVVYRVKQVHFSPENILVIVNFAEWELIQSKSSLIIKKSTTKIQKRYEI